MSARVHVCTQSVFAAKQQLIYTDCVSFVLLFLKLNIQSHLSPMAGCLPKVQTDDSGLCLHWTVTAPNCLYRYIYSITWLVETHTHAWKDSGMQRMKLWQTGRWSGVDTGCTTMKVADKVWHFWSDMQYSHIPIRQQWSIRNFTQ